MEYLWLILAVVGLPVLLLLRALRRLHDEPAVGFRHDIYEGRVQQAVRHASHKTAPPPEASQEADISAATLPETNPADEQLPPVVPHPEMLDKPLPDNRKALIQALLLSEVLKPRSK